MKTIHQREEVQTLVDICFSLVLTATDKDNIERFGKLSNEEKAAWVAKQLRGCGFETHPVGMSWGVLDK